MLDPAEPIKPVEEASVVPMDTEETIDTACNSVESTSKVGENSTEDSNDSSPTKARAPSPKGVATRSARRAKNKKNADEGIKKEEHVELKEPVKQRRGTALTNASNKRAQIQIGKAYQAPPVVELDPSQAELDEDRDVQVWHNDHSKVEDTKLDEFLNEAVGVYRLSMDRALYILQKAQYNMADARKEVQSRKIAEDEWSDDDKILFRMAYQQYGKNFAKIRQVMPYRSICNVIQYYYQVKKRWKDKSHIQEMEQVELLNTPATEHHIQQSKPMELRGNRKTKSQFFTGFDELPPLESVTESFLNGVCAHCAKSSTALREVEMEHDTGELGEHKTVIKKLCLHCSLHYETVQKLPEVDVIHSLRESQQNVYKCPEEYVDVLKDFSYMAVYVDNSGHAGTSAEHVIKATHKLKTRGHFLTKDQRNTADEHRAKCLRMEAVLDREYTQIPDVDQYRHILKEKLKMVKDRQGRRREEWTDQEKYFATHAFMRYGNNYEAVAEIVASKTIGQVKNFYESNQEMIEKQIKKREELLEKLAQEDAKKTEEDIEDKLKKEEEEEVVEAVTI